MTNKRKRPGKNAWHADEFTVLAVINVVLHCRWSQDFSRNPSNLRSPGLRKLYMEDENNVHALYKFLHALYKNHYFHSGFTIVYNDSPKSFAELLRPLPHWNPSANYHSSECRKSVIGKLARVIRDMFMRPDLVAGPMSSGESPFRCPIIKSLRPLSDKNLRALSSLTGMTYRYVRLLYQMSNSNFRAMDQPSCSSFDNVTQPPSDALSNVVGRFELVEVDGGHRVHSAQGFKSQINCCFYISFAMSISFHTASLFRNCPTRTSIVNNWVRQNKGICERYALNDSYLSSELIPNIDFGSNTYTSTDMSVAVVSCHRNLALAVLLQDEDDCPCLHVYKGKDYDGSAGSTILLLHRNHHYVACLPSCDSSLRPTLQDIMSLSDAIGLRIHHEDDLYHLLRPDILEVRRCLRRIADVEVDEDSARNLLLNNQCTPYLAITSYLDENGFDCSPETILGKEDDMDEDEAVKGCVQHILNSLPSAGDAMAASVSCICT